MRRLLLVLGLLPVSARAAEPDFNRDVRPILANKCFKCHGPDDKARKADLRLDVRDEAVKVGAIAPGKPAASKLVERIGSADPDEMMPPPSVMKPLTVVEKQVLREWIAAGAKYDPHWAFVKPKPAAPPAPGHPIDAFVRAKLRAAGLSPSPEADRPTLIRRVSLDLIGLPPTPAEVDAFVADTASDAYEKVVDRLLASPRYGERWARRWLDLARYADTNGYEKDRPRSIWPYRDYVIRAINDDVPFDRFTIEQIAGDLLPNPTADQIVATGFHRNTMLNEEGGIDPLEFRYHAVVDRANVTSTVWLGLTMGCAQCHTHKFDPISHTEYFRFLAFLNNAEEPDFEVPTAEQEKLRTAFLAQIASLEAGLPSKLPAEEQTKLLEAWIGAERTNAVSWTVLKPTRMEAGPTKLTLRSDGSIIASGDAMKRDLYSLTLPALPAGTRAIRIEALSDPSLPGGGPGRAYYEGPKGDFLLSEFTLFVDGKPVKVSGATATAGNPAPALDGHPQSGWPGAGKAGQPASVVFTLAEPLAAMDATLNLLFERHYSASLGRFRLSATTDERMLKANPVPAEVEALLLRDSEKWTPAERDSVQAHWASVAPELKAVRAEIEAVRKQLPRPATTLVMHERPTDHPRTTYRHHRGEFLQPKEALEPGSLAVLHPLPKGQPANRLTFARWLVSPENPLVGRVTVNRHWQAFFGRGLVRTIEDFGYQGEAPTHPELLDWLALAFIDQGWSVKKLHRLIVTSATYKQSSRVSPELLAKDPENTLLARGPRVRLEAEQIRDSLLAASGLLSAKMGGPSVFPPQPANITTEGTYGKLDWKVSEGEDRYRRGLYTFAKRTAPYAMFGTFDGPSGEACTARREVSNTPLQALTMLNDAVLTDAARALAQRVLGQKGTTGDRVVFLFRLCLARMPTAEERTLLAEFFTTQRERFSDDPKRAAAVAGPRENAVDRAAWAAVARAILNLDEFVTKE